MYLSRTTGRDIFWTLLSHSTSRGVTTDYIVWCKISAKLGMLPKRSFRVSLILYNAMIFPAFDYCAVVWASLTLVCAIFYLYLSCVLLFFFLFHQGPIQTSHTKLGTPHYILFTIKYNIIKINKVDTMVSKVKYQSPKLAVLYAKFGLSVNQC